MKNYLATALNSQCGRLSFSCHLLSSVSPTHGTAGTRLPAEHALRRPQGAAGDPAGPAPACSPGQPNAPELVARLQPNPARSAVLLLPWGDEQSVHQLLPEAVPHHCFPEAVSSCFNYISKALLRPTSSSGEQARLHELHFCHHRPVPRPHSRRVKPRPQAAPSLVTSYLWTQKATLCTGVAQP